MASKILITGATGFIGFRTLQLALKAGHFVRAAVRSQTKGEQLASQKSILPYASRFETVVVPDIVKDDAYVDAIKGVDYVIHLASPLFINATDYRRDYIEPAVNGTINMLVAASKEPKVKRVVVTGSFYSLVGDNHSVDTSRVYTADDADPQVSPGGPFPTFIDAYAASKALAWKASKNWMAEHKPKFDLVTILSAYVIGPHEYATTKEELLATTNRLVLEYILGDQKPPLWGVTISIHDIARLHVDAINPSIKGNESYIGAGPEMVWDDAVDVARTDFPDAVKNGTIQVTGSQPTAPFHADLAKTEKAFGFRIRPFKDQVKDLLDQYVSLAENKV